MATFDVQICWISKTLNSFTSSSSCHITHSNPFSPKIKSLLSWPNFRASIREEFWIINVKSVVISILDNYLLCQRLKVTPNLQFMSDIPAERLAIDEPAFSFTGVDCSGRAILKQSKKTRTNQDSQNTMVVVHLEVAGDLCTDSFILAEILS